MSELSRDRTPPAAGLPTLVAKAAAWDYLVGRVGDARALVAGGVALPQPPDYCTPGDVALALTGQR